MLRNVVLLLCLAFLAIPAFAVDVVSSGPFTDAVTMNLTIGSYAQIQVSTGFDNVINFSSDDATGPAPDYYRPTASGLIGAYSPLTAPGSETWPSTADRPTTDPWTSGYYESRDGADYWVNTNTTMTMNITPNGGLTNGSVTLPTWFTLAASGPFSLGGTVLNDGTIPGDGQGSYFADFDANWAMELGGTAFYPNQEAFDMTAVGMWVYSFPAMSSGSLKFLGRVLRNGMADPAGVYTTTMTLYFTAP